MAGTWQDVLSDIAETFGTKIPALPASASELWATIFTLIIDNPTHFFIEIVLVGFIAYIWLVKRAYDPAKKGYGGRGLPELTNREREELLAEWEPEPLVKPIASSNTRAQGIIHYLIESYVDGPSGVRVKIENRDGPCVTFCSQDFLGLGGEAIVRETAEATLEKYTVGSCGPRGFYGTTLAHLELEDALASFMSADESITYSDATATIASAIPAFAKRGDVLLVDDGANYGIQIGASLSRSKIVYWNHNDTADLAQKLEAVAESDGKRDASLEQRRFIVVEGLYANSGDMCPLQEVKRLAAKYRWRIMVDDSLGFGVLGREGRGITEHAGLTMRDIDVLVGSLATTLGSVGGFCVGAREVVDHQRLSGAGYCFSASAPPFLCASACMALKELRRDGEGKLEGLRNKCRVMHEGLQKRVPAVALISHEDSPVKHMVLVHGPLARMRSQIGAANSKAQPPTRMLSPTTQKVAEPDRRMAEARVQEESTLDEIVIACAAKGVLVSRTHALPQEAFPATPSLKVYLTLRHSADDIALLINTLQAVTEAKELHM